MLLNIDPPIVNASGILSFLDVFQLLDQKGANIGAYVTKSIGPRERLGNENPVVVENGSVSRPVLNSLALPSQTQFSWFSGGESSAEYTRTNELTLVSNFFMRPVKTKG